MDAAISTGTIRLSARRLLGICYGFGNQLLFLVTVWYLFWFLRDGSLQGGSLQGTSLRGTSLQGASLLSVSPRESLAAWWLRDCALALFFAAAHSVMLVPRTRRFLTRWIPAPFYDSTFCVVTCLSLLALFFGWRQSQTTIWELSGWAQSLIRVLFYFSWAALFYSLALTGLGYQNGWTPFYHWLRNTKAPRREFKPHGAYKLIRHPVYLSFLGLIWFTPRMTLDHAALTVVWTAYIFYGSVLKDRRLEHYIGKPYLDYERQVPGYPLVTAGPLGRRGSVRVLSPSVDEQPASEVTQPAISRTAP